MQQPSPESIPCGMATPQRPPTAPPPLDLEDEEEGDDPNFDDFQPEDEEPLTRRWLQERLGAGGVGDPRDNDRPTGLHARISETPAMAAAGIEGAAQWQIEKRNDETGEADWLGYAHLGITLRGFIRKFLESMPMPGEPAVTFYFTALDAVGTRIGPPGKPTGKLNVPADNEILLDLRTAQRARAAGVPGGGSEAGLVFTMLQQQISNLQAELKQERVRAQAEAAKIEALREAAYAERAGQGAAIRDDLSSAYRGLADTQKSMMGGVVDQVTAAANAERIRLQSTLDMEKMRLQADSEAKLALTKAEAEARVAQLKIEADLRAKEIELKIQESKDATERERQRIEREDERRRAERAEERVREDQRRADERAAEDRRRQDAAQADREHMLALEKLRAEGMAVQTAAISMQRELMASESQRGREHITLLASVLEKSRAQEGSGNKLGVIGEILDATGMTPGDAITHVKSLLGGTTLGTTIAQGITDVLKEVVKRLPAAEDELIEEAEENEWVEEPAPRQIETAPAPVPVRTPTPKPKPDPVPNKGPGLEAYLTQATEPDTAEPAQARSKDPASSSPASAATIPLPQLRAARSALFDLIESLGSETDPTKWPDIILGLDNLDAVVTLVSTIGLRSALLDSGVDVEDLDILALRRALIETGLFDTASLPESAC